MEWSERRLKRPWRMFDHVARWRSLGTPWQHRVQSHSCGSSALTRQQYYCHSHHEIHFLHTHNTTVRERSVRHTSTKLQMPQSLKIENVTKPNRQQNCVFVLYLNSSLLRERDVYNIEWRKIEAGVTQSGLASIYGSTRDETRQVIRMILWECWLSVRRRTSSRCGYPTRFLVYGAVTTVWISYHLILSCQFRSYRHSLSDWSHRQFHSLAYSYKLHFLYMLVKIALAMMHAKFSYRIFRRSFLQRSLNGRGCISFRYVTVILTRKCSTIWRYGFRDTGDESPIIVIALQNWDRSSLKLRDRAKSLNQSASGSRWHIGTTFANGTTATSNFGIPGGSK